jgi:peptide/nickel transport system permease protein
MTLNDQALVTGQRGGDDAWLGEGRRGPVHRIVTDPVGISALAFLAVVVTVAVLAPWLAPHDPIHNDLSNALAGPSSTNWMGTDELGRDVLSRLMYGARFSLLASFLATSVALVIGFPLGLVAGFSGGRVDRWVTRSSDIVQAMPGLVLLLAVLAVFGAGLAQAMVTLGFILVPSILRVVRAATINVRREMFVDAATIVGLPSRTIVGRHIIPHVLPALTVQVSLTMGIALLVEAGLSFIGLGVQPPTPSWGAMLSRATTYATHAPHLVFPSGIAIALSVLALNLLGDVIRDGIGPGVHRSASARKFTKARGPALPLPNSQLIDDGRAALLSVRGLSIAFPGQADTPVHAVTHVSFDIKRGEALGVVGESGCGKSITARALMGLVPRPGFVSQGSIQLDGRELGQASADNWRRVRGGEVAMVFQDAMAALDPAFTVGDQIAEGLILHQDLGRRSAQHRAIELLDRVGIADPSNRVHAYPHEFSGGMAQRAMIAAALAGDPELLIADEPTTALDVTVQAEILDLIRGIQTERGMSVLFITHDLGVVADICDRVLVMYAGQVVEEATVDNLFAHPRHPYTRALLQSLLQNQPRRGRAATIPGLVPSPDDWPSGCRFAPRCEFAVESCTRSPIHLEPCGASKARCIRANDLSLLPEAVHGAS